MKEHFKILVYVKLSTLNPELTWIIISINLNLGAGKSVTSSFSQEMSRPSI